MEVDDKGKECPVCGYEFPDYSKTFKLVALILVLLFLLMFLF